MAYRFLSLPMLFLGIYANFSLVYATSRNTSLPDLLLSKEEKELKSTFIKRSKKIHTNSNTNNPQVRDKKPNLTSKPNKKKVYIPKTNIQSQSLEQENTTEKLKGREKSPKVQPILTLSNEGKEEVQSKTQAPKPVQNSLVSEEGLKKKSKKPRSQKVDNEEGNKDLEESFIAQKSIINLPKDSIEQLTLKVEEIIQQIIQEKREEPLRVRVKLNKENIGEFHASFSKLIQKYPFPFTWSSTNKGPIDEKLSDSAWIIELKLSSLARFRERVEKEFVYQIAQQEEQKVDWPLIYDLAMRSGFSLEDFKYNNSLKIRVLELQGKNEEENLEEIKEFLETRLPKDSNPFHIVGIKVNKASGLRPSQLLNSFLKNLSYMWDNSLFDRGMIQDAKSDYFYLCLDNDHRKLLDLHGKKNQNSGVYDGRTINQARKETLSFIKQAYEIFQNEVTVLTGRGNHVSSNGQKGVLHEAFEKEWIKDKSITSKIKGYFPLEGNGGYKIMLVKPKKLDLGTASIEEALPLVKQTISQMVKKGQHRLFLQMATKTGLPSGDQEYKLMTSLAENLASQEPKLFKLLSPISFYSKPGELRFIFNQKHPRHPDSISWGNCFGISVNEGTIGSQEK